MTQGIVAILDKRDEENVDFDEFLKSVKTILLYENFFEELDPLFKHLDKLKLGQIRISELQDACSKLQGEQTDMRVPPASEVERIYKKMTGNAEIAQPGQLSHQEYLILLFKSTNDDSE